MNYSSSLECGKRTLWGERVMNGKKMGRNAVIRKALGAEETTPGLRALTGPAEGSWVQFPAPT